MVEILLLVGRCNKVVNTRVVGLTGAFLGYGGISMPLWIYGRMIYRVHFGAAERSGKLTLNTDPLLTVVSTVILPMIDSALFP